MQKAQLISKEEYLEDILLDIKESKLAGKRGVYRINNKISDETASYVKNYFLGKEEEFDFQSRKCSSCKGSWDIKITFMKL